jgi:hypothetical protein
MAGEPVLLQFPGPGVGGALAINYATARKLMSACSAMQTSSDSNYELGSIEFA